MPQTTSTLDIYITLVGSRLFNLSTQSRKPNLFKRSERHQRSELVDSEYKFLSFRWLSSSLWEKFLIDRSSLQLTCKSHCYHTSWSLTVSSLVKWKISWRYAASMRRFSSLIKTTISLFDSSILFSSLVLRSSISHIQRSPWRIFKASSISKQ